MQLEIRRKDEFPFFMDQWGVFISKTRKSPRAGVMLI